MRVWLLVSTLPILLGLEARAEDKKPAPEPRVSSIYPFTAQIGKTSQAIVRGRNLKGAGGIAIAGDGIEGRVLRVESEPPSGLDKKSESTTDLAYVEIASQAAARPGSRELRLLTSAGITNEIPLSLAAEPVMTEAGVPDSIRAFPVVIAGRISQRGEVDTFWFEAAAGQTLTFQGRSGHSSLDLSLGILESAPSWFDPNHMEQIAYNDEPLFFPGLSTDAQVVHTFRKAGRYCIKVQSFSGQASADGVYELRISTGAQPRPTLHPKLKEKEWEERQFTRELSRDRSQRLARRGGLSVDGAQHAESYRAVPLGSGRAATRDAPAGCC